ncbi:hypothetical protein B0H13DRAFT_1882892 [Mycena leptocephala]|nr:hypothetical protein B0H13DRAFT_1882892 [Mycena leptocephala]
MSCVLKTVGWSAVGPLETPRTALSSDITAGWYCILSLEEPNFYGALQSPVTPQRRTVPTALSPKHNQAHDNLGRHRLPPRDPLTPQVPSLAQANARLIHERLEQNQGQSVRVRTAKRHIHSQNAHECGTIMFTLIMSATDVQLMPRIARCARKYGSAERKLAQRKTQPYHVNFKQRLGQDVYVQLGFVFQDATHVIMYLSHCQEADNPVPITISNLPVETFNQIFVVTSGYLSCQSASLDGHNVNASDPAYQALCLSHVCRWWREIVLESPDLWAAGILAVQLAPTVSRWKNLLIDEVCLQVIAEANLALDSLEHLYLVRDPRPRVSLFSQCPKLVQFHLQAVGKSAGHLDAEVGFPWPWAQLTHLVLEDDSPTTCCSILQQCYTIVSATLRTTAWSSTAELKQLVQKFGGGDGNIAPFFTSFSLPVLVELSLRNQLDNTVAWPAEAVLAAFERSPNIMFLSISHCGIVSTDLIALLRLAPLLKSGSTTGGDAYSLAGFKGAMIANLP